MGCILGTAYGLFARICFGLEKTTGNVFIVMSSSFIIGVPVVLGFITVRFGEYRAKYGWFRRVFTPWLASLAYLGCCLALNLEGIICVVLWLPLALLLSSLGGLIAGLLLWFFPSDRSKNYCVLAVALLPFVAAPIESMKQAATQVRTVETDIEINAPAGVVWQQIRSVPKISEAEQSFDFSHLLGFPRPVEAVLQGEGVGAVRYARFEGKVLFTERVTEWEERKRLAFTIKADTMDIPPTTFDEHVTVGGRYFDVLRGCYWIEEQGPGRTLLHLSSDQRLSTGFNFYSHLWTEALMADLQNYILKIIKRRCETEAQTAKPV